MTCARVFFYVETYVRAKVEVDEEHVPLCELISRFSEFSE